MELDPNKCKAILHHKAMVFQTNSAEITPTTVISDEAELHNKEIDKFGELAVKRLKRPYRREFSDDEIEQIVSGYKSGNTTIKLAEQFGCSKNTINKLLRQHGVEIVREKAQAKLDVEKVITMYEEMHTTAEIAGYFGVKPSSVIRCLRAHGVKIRSRWDYPAEN